MSALLAILIQIGVAPTTQPVSPIPEELYEQRRLNKEARARQEPAPPSPTNNKLANCVSLIEINPEAARIDASRWRDRADLAQKASAAQCLGMALMQLGRWDEAAQSFINGRNFTLPDAQLTRARLGAMAGNALLAADNPADALTTLMRAQTDADTAQDTLLTGEIALDRARALVILGRNPEAAAVLTLARLSVPSSAQAWLLSATLSRRMNQLPIAQQQIDRASNLAPSDPEIGLEAGVIAVLSGRDDAARKSWQSVVQLAPGTSYAQTAQTYLRQIDQQ